MDAHGIGLAPADGPRQATMQTTQTILLVEDDLSLRASLCQFLNDHGYRTLTASTAAEGAQMLRMNHPRLCLLDLNLPDGSGLDLLRSIARSHAGPRGCRVVVMTAFDLKHIRPEEARGTLVAWLTKPVNPLELLDIVEKVMAGDPAGADPATAGHSASDPRAGCEKND
jgi:DNA-binding response OmpR family regulator